MSDKKPNVFPTQEQINQANQTGDQIATQLAEENNVEPTYGSDAEAAHAAEMRKKTEEQLRMREENLRKNEEIARQMDEKRAQQMNEKSEYSSQWTPPQQPPVPPSNVGSGYAAPSGDNFNMESYIQILSQPQMNQPFDLIPLPSEGKLYPSKKKAVKLAYLTTADENILTSPNLVESGDFLEILINRKLLEPDLRYKDLLPGDRNAIMLWLRATAYGEMYPVMLYDGDESFETEINLSELKTINLNVEPDDDGLFTFELPMSNNTVRFKMLTTGEIERLEKIIEDNKDNPLNEEVTLTLQNQIVEVNGNKDRTFINEFVTNMRIMDAKHLREYIGKIDCGVDMNITVGTPGGGSVTTFLPITPRFFWPNIQL